MVLSRNEIQNKASQYVRQYEVEDWLVNLEETWSSADTIIFIYTVNYAKLKTGLLSVIKENDNRTSKQRRTHFFKRID